MPFGFAIGLGAFLLFQVQFIMGKLILPWFGGAAAVWTTCMLFFQVGLLLGYAYAHLLVRWPPRRQRNLHLLVLGLSVALVLFRCLAWRSPLLPGDGWKPRPEATPTGQILVLLAFTAGLPYLVLSSTGPLLQAWFARARPGVSPYRLYALSNLGSLLGLLSYPFLLEPNLSLTSQGLVWALGFVLFAVGCSFCAVSIGRLPADSHALTSDPAAAFEPRPPVSRYALWFALAWVASVMLLATTNQICQEVAVIPFLWMLPLALYLLSFILCFEFDRVYVRKGWALALALAGVAGGGTLAWGLKAPLIAQIGIYSLILFVYSMFCHGELATQRPATRHLTSFYLTLSAGGAAGGLFTALLAPAIFPAFWELHIALFGGILLLAVLIGRARSPFGHGPLGPAVRVGGVAALLALGAGLVLQAGHEAHLAFYTSRNFYGTLRAIEKNIGTPTALVELKHGRIVHGLQFLDARRRHEPTTYYSPHSGVGLALRTHPRRLAGLPLSVGVVGLGAGTLAAYARPGDSFRIYEINPEVIRLSTGAHPIFHYLEDATGQVTTILGDARLSLERETAQDFDILALDAFSSDSIPAHLLTREAMTLYLRHLRRPDGILAVHSTNRYIDLLPVLRGLAESFGLKSLLVNHDADGDHDDDDEIYASQWVLLSRDPRNFVAKEFDEDGGPLDLNRRQVIWTDNYSDLLRLRRR